MAFDRLQPFDRNDLLLGQLLTWFANVNRDPKRRPQPFTLDDFLPDPLGPSPAEKRQAIADSYNKVYAAVAKHRAEEYHRTGVWKQHWGPKPDA